MHPRTFVVKLVKPPITMACMSLSMKCAVAASECPGRRARTRGERLDWSKKKTISPRTNEPRFSGRRREIRSPRRLGGSDVASI